MITNDQKVMYGGAFTNFSGTPVDRLVRLNSDGSIDATFDVGEGPNASLNLIKELETGEFVIAGFFDNYQDNPATSFAKISNTGQLNESFVDNLPFSESFFVSVLPVKKHLILGGVSPRIGAENYTSGFISIGYDGSWNQAYKLDNGQRIGVVINLVEGPENTVFVLGDFYPNEESDVKSMVKMTTNVPPQITDVLLTNEFDEGSNIELNLSDLTIRDIDSEPEDLSLTVLPGDNYTVSGNTIELNADYFGPITVGLRVSDGVDQSNIYEWAINILSESDTTVISSLSEDVNRNISLRPNPAKNFLTFNYDQQGDNLEIYIRDYLGRMVDRENIDYSSDKGEYLLDITSVNPGMYVLSVIEKGKTVFTTRFVKQ